MDKETLKKLNNEMMKKINYSGLGQGNKERILKVIHDGNKNRKSAWFFCIAWSDD